MIKNRTLTLRLGNIIAVFISVCIVLVSFLLLYWASRPDKVLVVNNSPVPAQPSEVADGGKVFLDIDFCKLTGAVGKADVNLIGENFGAKVGIAWPLDDSPAQCIAYPEIPVRIPAQTPTDTYHLEFTICYYVNPLKKDQCTTFTSQSFRVVNSKLNPGDAKTQVE